MWMDGVTSGCVHCSVWAEGLLGATGQPIGSRDPRAVRSRWEGDSGAGIVNVTVTVATVSAGASDRKVCEANTMAWAVLAVLAVLSRGIMGMTWTLTLRSVDQMSTQPPPPFDTSQRGDRDCQSAAARVPRWDCLLSRSIPTATTTGTSPACLTAAFKWSNLKG